jgi:CheY-like chemotaxis protein
MAQTGQPGNLPVLVIEADGALRRVIEVGLRQRGFEVVAVPSLGEAWESIRVPPAVVVLDVGIGAGSEWGLLRMLRTHRLLGPAPLVLLAWECPSSAAEVVGERGVRRVCLAKPFDARALYAAVEGLLAERVAGVPASQGTGSAEGALVGTLAGGAVGPSVWPLVTAAGAIVATTGFLVNVALVVAGLAIVFAALLWWGFEARGSASSA